MNQPACLICGGETQPLLRDLFDDRYGAPGRHTVSRCQGCGFGRTTPGLEPAEIGPFYARYYPLARETAASVRAAAHIPPRWQAWLSGTDNIAHHHVQPNSDVLDIGSASGVSLLEISQQGGHAYGVEPDPNAARIARELGLKVHTGFITDNPFPGQKFDLITTSQVIEHAPDPRVFLKAVAARLKPGGKIILAFPNLNAAYRRVFGRRWLHWHIPYHLNFFTRRSFVRLAQETGLEVTSSRTITPNLWTVLQFRALATPLKEGRMANAWAAQHGQTAKPNRGLIEFGVRLGLPVLKTGVLFMNRSLDSLGLGESFLVVLRKTSRSEHHSS